MERAMKRVRDSYTEQVQILSLDNMNGYNRLHGGQLMGWIDVVAAVTARRHCGGNVTTAVVDMLRFEKPAYANDILVITGTLTFVGRTSMEICVKTYTEKSGVRDLINEAYVVMVALDDAERPTEVPGLLLETEEEKEQWQRAELRRRQRKEFK